MEKNERCAQCRWSLNVVGAGSMFWFILQGKPCKNSRHSPCPETHYDEISSLPRSAELPSCGHTHCLAPSGLICRVNPLRLAYLCLLVRLASIVLDKSNPVSACVSSATMLWSHNPSIFPKANGSAVIVRDELLLGLQLSP